MEKNKDVMKFVFQEIAIAEIPKFLSTTYRSKYADLCAQIMERINSMASDKSFMFKSDSNGKTDKKFIRTLTVGINGYFAKNRFNWRVAYSHVAKAFVIAPYERKNGIVTRNRVPQAPRTEVAQTGFKDDPASRLDKLVHLMKKEFDVTLRQLQERNATEEIKDFKRGMLYVGRHGLGLRVMDVAAILNIPMGTTTAYCQQALTRPSSKKCVEKLSAALNRG